MLNIKAIIPMGNEALLAAAWKAERKGFKQPKPRTQSQGVNQKQIDRNAEIRGQVLGALASGVGSAIAIANAIGVHESTARAHLRELREAGRVEGTKVGSSPKVIWRVVK